jgi:transcriptional regulator with PAS, ATPase and Fis domain
MAKRAKKNRRLDVWLAESRTPIFVLDHRRTVVAFNAGCEALTGWSAAELLGETCPYATAADAAGAQVLAAALCPPHEVWQGEAAEVPAFIPQADGPPLSRMLHLFPLLDDQERVTGVAGFIQPMPAARTAPVNPAWELHAELAALRMTLRARFGPNSLVGRSPAMQRVVSQVELARQTMSPLLLLGEPGTGREHLARTIHFGSSNKATAFVPLDCRRLAADEVERVLHRLLDVHRSRGASSGAGLQPGTVYLADVDKLPRDLQELLIRDSSPESDPQTRSGLRLMASLSRDPKSALADESLRGDFFALIAPLVLELPPLRDRPDDLPLLAQYFLEESNRQHPKQLGGFSDDVWPLFAAYHWPGNLDELADVVQQAHAAASESLVRPDDLPARFRAGLDAREVPPPAETPALSLDPLLEKLERQLITLALTRARFNKSRAAELLGINRQRLLRRIEQLQIADPTAEADGESPRPAPANDPAGETPEST